VSIKRSVEKQCLFPFLSFYELQRTSFRTPFMFQSKTSVSLYMGPDQQKNMESDDPYDFELECSTQSGEVISNSTKQRRKEISSGQSQSSNDSSLASILRCIEDSRTPKKENEERNIICVKGSTSTDLFSSNNTKKNIGEIAKKREGCNDTLRLSIAKEEERKEKIDRRQLRNELTAMQTKIGDDDCAYSISGCVVFSDDKVRDETKERLDQNQTSSDSSLASILRCIESDESRKRNRTLLQVSSHGDKEVNKESADGDLTGIDINDSLLDLSGKREGNADANIMGKVKNDKNVFGDYKAKCNDILVSRINSEITISENLKNRIPLWGQEKEDKQLYQQARNAKSLWKDQTTENNYPTYIRNSNDATNDSAGDTSEILEIFPEKDFQDDSKNSDNSVSKELASISGFKVNARDIQYVMAEKERTKDFYTEQRESVINAKYRSSSVRSGNTSMTTNANIELRAEYSPDGSSVIEDVILDESSSRVKDVHSGSMDGDIIRCSDTSEFLERGVESMTTKIKNMDFHISPVIAANPEGAEVGEEQSEASYTDDGFVCESDDDKSEERVEEYNMSTDLGQSIDAMKNDIERENTRWNKSDSKKGFVLDKVGNNSVLLSESFIPCEGSYIPSKVSEIGDCSKVPKRQTEVENVNMKHESSEGCLINKHKTLDIVNSKEHINYNVVDTRTKISETKNYIVMKDASTQATGNDAGTQVNIAPVNMSGTKSCFDKPVRDPVTSKEGICSTKASTPPPYSIFQLNDNPLRGNETKENWCNTVWNHGCSNKISSSCIGSESLQLTPYDVLKPLFQGQQQAVVKNMLLRMKKKEYTKMIQRNKIPSLSSSSRSLSTCKTTRNTLQFWEALMRVDPHLSIAEAKLIEETS